MSHAARSTAAVGGLHITALRTASSRATGSLVGAAPVDGKAAQAGSYDAQAGSAWIHVRGIAAGALRAAGEVVPPPEGQMYTGEEFNGEIDLDKKQVRPIGTPRVHKLADEIVELTLLEVNDLVEILTERLNLPAPTGLPMGGMIGNMQPGVGGMPPSPNVPGAAPAEAPVEEKTEFDLKLESFDKAAKIKVIKEIRVVTELGLKEAKELVEGAPCVIKKMVGKADAEAIIAKLKEVGAEVAMV